MITVSVTAADIRDGVRWSAFHDPIVLAICRATGRLPEAREVSVSTAGIVVGRAVFETPELVREFIREFDRGEKVIPFSFELWAPGEQELIG